MQESSILTLLIATCSLLIEKAVSCAAYNKPRSPANKGYSNKGVANGHRFQSKGRNPQDRRQVHPRVPARCEKALLPQGRAPAGTRHTRHRQQGGRLQKLGCPPVSEYGDKVQAGAGYPEFGEKRRGRAKKHADNEVGVYAYQLKGAPRKWKYFNKYKCNLKPSF